jgi:tetratricopeptide (TPR) repeat protein
LSEANYQLWISDCGLRITAPPIRNPQSAIRNLHHRRALITSLTLLLGAALSFSGCKEPEAAKDSRTQQERLQRAERGAALIDAATAQLADLPSAVDTELRPPTVILDSTKSMNRQDVLAIAVANPNAPGNPVNLIGVPGQNGRFKGVGVRSGDILKYYIVEDETIDEERRQAGLARQLAKELTIAQVIDDNTLLIEGSLPEQVLFPAKLEIWRNVDDRLEEINDKLVRYAEWRLPALGWEPSPDEQVFVQIVAWLNQWLRQSEPKTDWQREALLDSLDPQLLANEELKAMLTAPALAEQVFDPYDGRLLQEAVWLRDISRWAQGDNFNDLARATALFDWTVRNIQLEPDENAPPRRHWRTLVEGRGTAEERAWVFALLCRQQALDVVMLEIPAAEGEQASGPQPFWLPALVLNDQLYLFDTRLGLPIPGPGGEGIATLAEVQQDDALLRQLDVGDARYAVNAEAAKKAVARVVASPFELSRRARQLESKLTGDNHLVLSIAPSDVAKQLKEVPELGGVKLWDTPFRTLRDQLVLGKTARLREALAFEPFAMRPLLWKARMRHFQGRRQRDAKSQEDAIDDHREATQLYTRVRPLDTKIARLSSAEERRVDTTVKQNATYWIGLLSFDVGKFEVAADWLGRSGLGDADSPWSAGARYNRARALEAQGKFEEATKLLEEDTSPQRQGNLLRAKMLRARAEKEKAEESK